MSEQSQLRSGRIIDSHEHAPDKGEDETLRAAQLVTHSEQPDTDWPQEEDIEAAVEKPLKKKSSMLKVLFAWSLLALVLVETALSVYVGFQTAWWLGALYSVVIVLAVLFIGKLLVKELINLKRLRLNRHHQEQAQRLLASEQIGQALPWLESVNKIQTHPDFETFKASVAEHLSDREVMVLYRDTLLVSQDKQAKQRINRYAMESSLLVAVSPLAVVDMLAVLWRGLKLVDEIANTYGLALGYAARVRLYRSLVKQMLFVGSTELLADLAATAFGTKLLSVLSTRAAQGLSAGVLTARIGYKAMELCRPLPKLENKNSMLRAVVKQIGSRLMSQTEDKSHS